VVDASEDADLFKLANGNVDTNKVRTKVAEDYFKTREYVGLSRTGVAVGDVGGQAFTLPLGALVPANGSNMFLTRKGEVVKGLLNGTANDIPLLMQVGQAVGAVAAYTAFFK